LKKLLFFLTLCSVASLFSCHSKKRESTTLSVDYSRALRLWDKQPDSAFYYFNRVAGLSHDSLQVAKAYNCMAQIQSDAGDDYGAQESLVQSLEFLHQEQQSNHHCLAGDYNELGITSDRLQHFDQAIQYFNKAIDFDDDHKLELFILNNEATAFRKKNDYSHALQLYQQLIGNTPPQGKFYAQLLTNIVIPVGVIIQGLTLFPNCHEHSTFVLKKKI